MSTISGTSSRKRTAPSPPPSVSERSSKRSRLHVQVEENAGASADTVPVAGRQTHFKLPPNAEELSEANLAVLLNGEEEPENAQDSNLLPVRRLSNFTFFYADTTRVDGAHDFVGLEKLLRKEVSKDRRAIAAHGAARKDDADLDEAAFEGNAEAEDNPDDPGPGPLQFQYCEVILESIECWWIGNGVSNADMYIRTKSAWYLLEEPSDSYRKTFTRFWIPHRLSQAMADYALKASENPYKMFCESIHTLIPESTIVIGRQITVNDLDVHRSVIQDDLKRNSEFFNFSGSKVIKQYFQIKGATPPPFARSPHAPPGVEISAPRIVVSRLVQFIAQRYFKTQLEVAGPSPKHLSWEKQAEHNQTFDIRQLDLGRDELRDGSIKYYESITFEGKYHYKVGDYVATVTGKYKELEERARPPPLSTNQLANTSWFARIHRLFMTFDQTLQPPRRHWAHVQWFDHGTMTDLGELAAPNELFETYNCSDIGLATIKKHISIQFVKCDSSKTIPTAHTEGLGDDQFFCRYMYHTDDGSYHDLSQPKPFDLAPRDTSKLGNRLIQCPVCDAKVSFDREEGAVTPIKKTTFGIVRSILFKNTPYHRKDTVFYYDDEETTEMTVKPRQLKIGIVRGWSVDEQRNTSNLCSIQKLGYRDDLVRIETLATTILPAPTDLPLDERCLYITREFVNVPIKNLERHCVVHCIPDWQELSKLDSEPNHFFITHLTESLTPTARDLVPIQGTPLDLCKICAIREQNWKLFREPYKRLAAGKRPARRLAKVTQLKTLDLFSGAGGLAHGLRKSGLFSFRWAIENDIHTARTYRFNFPEAKVFTQDVNVCAANALSPVSERKRIPSLDINIRNGPDHMPAKGEVEAIIAGPPCPDFSNQNIYRYKAGESSTGLVLPTLSLIDFYRPQFFMIENVPGMLRHEAVEQETGELVEFAMVKIILRSLTTLGYSVRWGVFNSVNYGSPQLRTRMIFYGSRGGYRLPDIPIPTHLTHTNPCVAYTRFTGTATKLTEPDAPLPGASIATSIGDLPAFEWKVDDPVTYTPRRVGVPVFLGESERGAGLAGFTGEGVRYAQQAPVTLYQARARAQVEPDEKVTLHVTRTFAKGRGRKAERYDLECFSFLNRITGFRVMSVPLLAKADHRKIPRELNDWAHSNALSAAGRTQWAPGRYGRLDWQGFFQSAITRIDPTAKQGRVLHPSQRRVLSIREAARSQGLPDHYSIFGNARSVTRQIGNSFPVQLAEAFGRVFRDAVICHRAWHELGVRWPEWQMEPE
ncbi:hypothetical protein M408DRAFT_25007 [Serendipita vermifera MAFF 305830]|uniref:Cytosine-specific methyltransferase n=1 Tax=Serendipita vermifera MAFF 305830 TaxID=933852 RepID=A0A0C2WKZ6_SERVB|nr:hypothetical protein M408DRAFT_25007 [Serendipita vermifera MAFF 305830]